MSPRRTRTATLDDTEKELRDRWGDGVIMRASDPSLQITRIPCGVRSVDDLLGGGFARGRYTEVYGGYSLGKTALALRLIASIQAAGGKAAFVDAEHSFDPVFAKSLGVGLDDLRYHEQESGNRCVDYIEAQMRAGDMDVIVLDSIAALLPKGELESSSEQARMGTEQAKLMSAALRKLTVANRSTVLFFINQTREAIGVMFGNRDLTSGGKAMGFYAGTRLCLTRSENLKRKTTVLDPKTQKSVSKDVVVGHRVLVRIEKDKTSARMMDTSTFVFSYSLGNFDPVEDLIYLGLKYEAVQRRNDRWWVEGYEDEAQNGRPRFKKWLRQNVVVAEDLEQSIQERSAEYVRTQAE